MHIRLAEKLAHSTYLYNCLLTCIYFSYSYYSVAPIYVSVYMLIGDISFVAIHKLRTIYVACVTCYICTI